MNETIWNGISKTDCLKKTEKFGDKYGYQCYYARSGLFSSMLFVKKKESEEGFTIYMGIKDKTIYVDPRTVYEKEKAIKLAEEIKTHIIKWFEENPKTRLLYTTGAFEVKVI